MNKIIFLLLLSLVLLPLHVFTLTNLYDYWSPIKNVKDPHIIGIGKFAVSEYNRQNKTELLKFVTVVRGEYQIVSGVNFRLVVTADGIAGGDCASKNYEATVLEKQGLGIMNLTSFKPLLQNRFL